MKKAHDLIRVLQVKNEFGFNNIRDLKLFHGEKIRRILLYSLRFVGYNTH